MFDKIYDVIVVGGGHAVLCLSEGNGFSNNQLLFGVYTQRMLAQLESATRQAA